MPYEVGFRVAWSLAQPGTHVCAYVLRRDSYVRMCLRMYSDVCMCVIYGITVGTATD